jgi:hypothetical protein
MYGVECNYNGLEDLLQISGQGSFAVDGKPAALSDRMGDFDGGLPQRNDHHAENDMFGLSSLAYSPSDHTRDHRSLMGTDFLLSPLSSISMSSTMAAMIDDSLQVDLSAVHHQSELMTYNPPTPFWHFSASHLEILSRFRDRTALTIGDKRIAPAYRDCICHLALSVRRHHFAHFLQFLTTVQSAFLMHMLLGLTLMHDADLASSLSPSSYAHYKHAGLQHWNTGSKLFNQILSKPISPHQRDAIWATGVIIGATSFWFVNSTKVEEVWPLKPSEADDLAWLRLGEGKKSLWRLCDPTRSDSIFSTLMKNKGPHCPSAHAWINTYDTTMHIPSHIQRLFDITSTSTIENNVYYLPLFILSRIQHLRLTHENVLNFLYFAGFLTPELLRLFEIKEPRAVFILGWWFKIIEDGELWWMASRAKIEGRAVRIWLQKEEKTRGLAQVLDDLVREPALRTEDESAMPISIWGHDWKTGEMAA